MAAILEPKTKDDNIHPCNDIHTVYLAGKMRGVEKYNHPLFDQHAEMYRKLGFRVISPAEIDREDGLVPDMLPKNHDWNKASELLRRIVANCLNQALNKADAIFLLPGWETSRGTCAEISVAMWLGKPVFEKVESATRNHSTGECSIRATKLTFKSFIARVHAANYPTGDITVSYDGALLGQSTPESTKSLQQQLQDLWQKPVDNDNSNQPSSDVTKFSTGAVRSADRAKERYDLISPIGVRRVLAMLHRNSLFVANLMTSRLIPNPTQEIALNLLYNYLSGQRDRMEATMFIPVDSDDKPDSSHEPHNVLELAAVCIMMDIAEARDRKNRHNVKGVKSYALNAGMATLARVCHEGAEKYSDYNWEKGMPVSDILNHAIAHLLKHDAGDTSEDHLGHALWNVFAAMHSEELWPELNKNLRLPGCKPPCG